MLDHFRASCKEGFVYSLDTNAAGTELLPLLDKMSALPRPAPLPDPQRFDGDVGEGGNGNGAFFFSVVRKSYSKVRVVSVPAAASCRLGPDDIGIVQHDCLHAEDGHTAMVSVQPSALSRRSVTVLSRLGADVDFVKQGLLAWKVRGKLSYTLDGLGFNVELVDAITEMVRARTYPKTGQLYTVQHQDEQTAAWLPHLERVEAMGLVAMVDGNAGFQHANAFTQPLWHEKESLPSCDGWPACFGPSGRRAPGAPTASATAHSSLVGRDHRWQAFDSRAVSANL